MIITPSSRAHPMMSRNITPPPGDIMPRASRLRRPKTSHPRLISEDDDRKSCTSEEFEAIYDLQLTDSPPDTPHTMTCIPDPPPARPVPPPVPHHFTPTTSMLIHATQKRLSSLRSSTLMRPATAKVNKRISRTKRVKSATSRSEVSDDDTNASQADTEWNWLSEPFDFDAEPEDEDKLPPKKKDIHSVEVYRAACQRLGQVPSKLVCSHMATRDLKLKNSHLDSTGAKAIAIALVVNGSIESVNLEGNVIGAKGASYICEALQENAFISEVNLSHNRLMTEGVRSVCKAIGKNQTVRCLDISGNGLEDFDAVHIAGMLRENYALKELSMHHNSLRERGGMILANAVADNDTLEMLDISWNHLRRKGASAICECLRKNTGLKVLNVAWNGLYLDGARALRRSLPENKTLHQLDISSNRLTEECIKEIMVGLKRSQTLKVLKMANSPMTVTGCQWFLTSLMSYDVGVEKIDMTNQTVDIAFVRKYEELRRMKNIHIVHGIVAPPYLQLDDGETDSDVFINDDPMIVLMEYMRIQNLRLLDLFSSLDADNSKSLSREEFRQGMLQANIPLSSEALDKLIRHLDSDGDGEVDFNELLEGLKAHKRKVSKIMARQKHLKFEESDIGKINLKINALLQFRMMYHKINLAKSKSEQEALQTTLQEFNDKLSDLSDMKRNMLQAGMERAKAQAIERQVSRAEKAFKLAQTMDKTKGKLTATLSKNNKTASDEQANKKKRLASIARAMSAPAKKK